MRMPIQPDAMVTSSCGQHVFTVLGLLMIIECIISLELLELRVPAHVALGARAQLSCRWALGPADVLYSVKWYKDGREFFRHVPRDTEPRRKFPLPGVDVEKSDESGSRLVLSAVVSATAGRYRCEVSGERPLFATVSEHADMEVIAAGLAYYDYINCSNLPPCYPEQHELIEIGNHSDTIEQIPSRTKRFVLPDEGPVITGLHTRYYNGDSIQVSCTSGRCKPACQLSWYINGEPAPVTSVLPPTHKVHDDELVTTTLLLDFRLTEQHAKKNSVKVKCLATLTTLYWRSNEESALIEKVNIRERMLPNVKETSTRADRVHTNLALALSSSPQYIICIFAVLYTHKLYIHLLM